MREDQLRRIPTRLVGKLVVIAIINTREDNEAAEENT